MIKLLKRHIFHEHSFSSFQFLLSSHSVNVIIWWRSVEKSWYRRLSSSSMSQSRCLTTFTGSSDIWGNPIIFQNKGFYTQGRMMQTFERGIDTSTLHFFITNMTLGELQLFMTCRQHGFMFSSLMIRQLFWADELERLFLGTTRQIRMLCIWENSI